VRSKQISAGQGRIATAALGGATINAAGMGTWGNRLQVCIASAGSDQAPSFDLQVMVPASAINPPHAPTDQATQLLAAYVTQNGLAPVTVNTIGYYVLETFNGLTAADAAFQARINTQSIFVRVSAIDSKRLSSTPAPVALHGGQDPGWDFIGALQTLATVPTVSLLAIPDTVGITDSNGATHAVLQAQLVNQGLNLCEQWQNLVYAIDPPYGQNVAGVLSFKSGAPAPGTSQAGPALNCAYGALYYPWVWVLNPLSNTNVPIPPSGPVLGRYAYTDTNDGVWIAPAGVSHGAMRTVTSLAASLTDADQDTLNPNGINALRSFVNYGNVIYGARTTSLDSQWTYISVRRLFIFVEQSLKSSLQWVAFEANDQNLWAAVSRDINAFLTHLWQQGALFGATAQEAFFVVCDSSNNPPETRALGQLYIDIGLASVYPAEFVITRVSQKTASSE
jgi:hypothetical protein